MTAPADRWDPASDPVVLQLLRVELRALLAEAFPTDTTDYHYGLEALLDAVRRRLAELDDLPTEECVT